MDDPQPPATARPRGQLVAQLVRGIPGSSRSLALIIALLTCIAGLLPAAVAVMSQRTFDAIVDRQPVLLWIIAFLCAGFALAVVGAIIEHLEGVLGRAVQASGMEILLDSVNSLPTLREMEDPEFRDRLIVAQDSGTQAPTEVFSAAMSTTRTALTVVSMGALLWAFAPWAIALVILGAGPVAALMWRRSRSQAALAWRVTTHRRRSDFYAQLLTDLQAAKEIRLFATASFFRSRMSDDLRDSIQEENAFSRRWTALQVGAEIAAALAAGVVIVVMVLRASSGRISVGDLTMLLAAVAAIQTGLIQLLDSASRLAARLMNFRTFVDLVHHRGLDSGEERHPTVSASTVIGLEPHPRYDALAGPGEGLIFEEVSFRYPGSLELALDEVTLHLPRGATAAIVGPNGSGKSTLVKLICRFYRPTTGRILWDGRDIWSLPVEEYRELLTGVFQDYMAYDLSVRENVAISDFHRAVDDARVWQELDEVGLGARVRAMERQLDTTLSRTIYMDDDFDSNALLSGGQWQRLAVARARYRGARDIQLYDEPTANLDPLAEWEITQVLDQRHPRSVAVCVSHRLQTVRGAARIVVLEHGRVTEQGTHIELMELGGTYCQMYDRQQSSFLEAASVEATRSAATQDDREDLPVEPR